MENKTDYDIVLNTRSLTQSDINAINKAEIGNMVSLSCGAIIKIINNPNDEHNHCNGCCLHDCLKCHILNCINHGKNEERVSYLRIK